ncbi:MAG: DNA polymerase III subunit gamma/tau [Lachnospiraceae bacterium]|nr:DNA polymerase III subunit gamma/tau [Lachnospiraceae bacterium]
MSYTALYRKFRPDSFEDVKGQDHIVTTLKNQIKAERIGHAYLFCGTRGTGKTTIAKILARAVNCEHPVDGNPCNECAMCKAIKAQTSMNVIEIDAASNNGVDNIREIVEEVRYSPTEGKYKVYIIDEVHMLSAGAFNALLKTLEEPPSYVIFILATTEVHKIPITILSRCQRYDFKRISIERIAARLEELTTKEGIETEEKALKYVARAADGSMRDALSLLDQCIAFYLGQKLTYDNVLDVLGTVDIEVFARLLRYIRKGSVSECVGLLEELISYGRELTQFTVDFTWYLRNLLLAKTSDDIEDILEVSTDQLQLLKQEAASVDAEMLIRYIRIFSELSNQIKYATQKRVMVEVALIKLCKPAMETTYDSLIDRIKVIERQLKDGVSIVSKNETRGEEAEDVKNEPLILPKAVSEDLKMVAAQWRNILSNMPPLVRTVLITTKVVPGSDNQLMLVFDNEVDKRVIDADNHMEDVKNAIAKVIGKEVAIQTKLVNEGESLNDFPDLTKIIKNVPIEYVD